MGPVGAIFGAISAVAGVVGGVMQYASQQRQVVAARAQGEAQARVAEENARQIQVANQLEKYKRRRQLEHIMGTQRAALGASGVVLSEGTPLQILEDTAHEAELEDMAAQYKADQQSKRWQTEADIYRVAGSTMAGAYASQSGTSLLTGVATGVARGIGAWDSYQSWKFRRAGYSGTTREGYYGA